MRTLFLPDVHTHYQDAQRIIDKVKADRVIFAGDMFDDFSDTIEINVATAKYVKSNLDKYTFILGNHDQTYRWNNITKCSGWTLEKHRAINLILTKNDWDKFKLFEVVDGWLLTHAGLTFYNLPPKIKDVIKWLNRTCQKALRKPESHWILSAGIARGGSEDYGGITWCDALKEFAPILGIKQCFGHTPLRNPKWFNDDNVCIDTYPALCNYALIENGKLTVHDI